MSIKDRVQELFDRFQVELSVDEPQKLASAKLESGQEIQTDAEAFNAGAAVFVTNDEGERIPLPDGDYTMEDGSKFQVKDGVIAEEEEKTADGGGDAPAEPKEEEMSQDEARQMLQDALKPMVETMIQEAIAPLVEKMSAQTEQMDKLAAEPASDPIPRVKAHKKTPDPVDLKTLSVADRVKAIQAQFMNHG